MTVWSPYGCQVRTWAPTPSTLQAVGSAGSSGTCPQAHQDGWPVGRRAGGLRQLELWVAHPLPPLLRPRECGPLPYSGGGDRHPGAAAGARSTLRVSGGQAFGAGTGQRCPAAGSPSPSGPQCWVWRRRLWPRRWQQLRPQQQATSGPQQDRAQWPCVWQGQRSQELVGGQSTSVPHPGWH